MKKLAKKRPLSVVKKKPLTKKTSPRRSLLGEVRELILTARRQVAMAVDCGLVTLYWQVGTCIRRDILMEIRAEDGKKIVSALGTQLGWTHFRQIIALDEPLKRDFYAEMCRIEKWNTRTLEKKIGIILCAGKRSQHVELLDTAKSGIHVASYWTKVLPKKLLERKLHDAVSLARARIENTGRQ